MLEFFKAIVNFSTILKVFDAELGKEDVRYKMYIHIGNRKTLSGSKLAGLFNVETIRMSDENKRFFSSIEDGDKTIFIDRDNNLFLSKISPFTVIKRTDLECTFIWRRDNDQTAI